MKSEIAKIKKAIILLLLFSPQTVWAKTVVVVGAGLAGLTVANELIHLSAKNPKDKLEVQVLEAKDRPGGRVLTVLLNGQRVEMGGENINDGDESKNFLRLVRRFHLSTTTQKVSFGDAYYFERSTGKKYHLYRDLMAGIPTLEAAEVESSLKKLESSAQNLKQVIDAFFTLHTPTDPSLQANWKRLQSVIEDRMQGFEGGTPDRLSPRYAHGSLVWMITSLYRGLEQFKKGASATMEIKKVAGGNSKLILALAKNLGSRLRLDSPVQEIRRNADSSYTLKIGEGSAARELRADVVVLTLPAKAYSNVTFDERTVPKERVARIASIGYGTHAKILVHLNAATSPASFTVSGIRGWVETETQNAFLYYSGGLGVMEDVAGFVRAYDQAAAPLSLFGNLPKRPTISVPSRVFGAYTSAVGLSWAQDPYILGSYSYYTPELRADLETEVEAYGEKVLPLFTPIDARIFFAGEHTTIHQDIRGTMEAAVESGFKASRMVRKALRNF